MQKINNITTNNNEKNLRGIKAMFMLLYERFCYAKTLNDATLGIGTDVLPDGKSQCISYR